MDEKVKELVRKTGLSPSRCKNAMYKYGDNFDEAYKYLVREHGGKQSCAILNHKLTAREYIEKYTRKCSNRSVYTDNADRMEEMYEPWLTPYHAECAAEIAREEVIEKACEWINRQLITDEEDPDFATLYCLREKFIEGLYKAMKGE